MTRYQFKQRARTLLQTGKRGTLAGDPFSDDTELDAAANELCKATDCFFISYAMNITAGVSKMCPPPIYKIKAAYSMNDSGQQYELSMRNTRAQDNGYGLWRSETAQSNAGAVLLDGMNRLIIMPTPSVSRTGGLIITGFAETADVSGAQTYHLWKNDTDECPIAQEGHQAVLYNYIVHRLVQMLASDDDKEVAKANRLLPQYRAMYDDERGRLESFAATRYSTMRAGHYPCYGSGYY